MGEESNFSNIAGPVRPRVFSDRFKHKSRKQVEKPESYEALWVKSNLGTKNGGNSKDKVETVEINAFGEIEFKGATRRAKAKFIQIANDSSTKTVFQLLTKIWKIDNPKLLISVTGGAKSFSMDPKLKEMFANGLRKVAQTPGAWVITGGTNTGVMKHVGEALQGQTKALIGIATWGIVSNKNSLLKSGKIPLGGKFPYKVESSLVQSGAYLDHNHTHFLLIHDGSEEKYGREINFRSDLENYIMKNSTAPQQVPSVVLVLEGGPGTVKTVSAACKRGVPVVLIKGSGRAADILAYAYENVTDEYLASGVHPELMQKIKENFPELSTDERQEDFYSEIIKCMSEKQSITVFKISGDDLDEAILSAVLTNQNTQPGIQLQLTLLWDRADLAESYILSQQSIKWKHKDLQNAIIMALALDRVEIVKLLLNYCVSVNSILTKHLLEFLYGYRSKVNTSTLKYFLSSKDRYTPIGDNYEYEDTVEKLCSYIDGLNKGECCIPYAVFQRIIMRLCRHLIKKEGTFIQNMESAEPNDTFDYPYKELFFWALLNNMHDMALFLWQMEEEGTAKAIVATEINKVLAEKAEQKEFKTMFTNNANEFQTKAIKILDECFSTNQEQTESVITRELMQFPGHTCLSLANCSNQEEFIAHSSVQQLLNDVWTGAMKSREISTFSLFTAILFPPLIFRFNFRNKVELRNMIHVEQEDEDGDETDGNHSDKNVIESNASTMDDTNDKKYETSTSGSDIKLKLFTPAQSYKSTETNTKPTEEIHQEECKIEMKWYRKIYEFYFKVPVIKFLCSVISYFIFLGLFTYVAILKKEDPKPGIAEYILIVFVVSLALEEVNQMAQSTAHGIYHKLKEYFSSIWNIMDILAVTLFFVGLWLRLHEKTLEYGHLIYAIDSWIWILRLLNVFYAHRILGPYVVMIGKMFIDMMYFITILVVFMVAYGVSTSAILKPRKAGWSMLADIFFHPYFIIYGELFIERDEEQDVTRFGTPYINSYAEPITWVLLALYLLVANVLLLNLLIAIFGNTFQAVQEKSDQVWKFERYGLVVEYEKRPALVPPFIILSHIWMFLRFIFKTCKKCSKDQKEKEGLHNDLQKTLTNAEKEANIEFEMGCIATVLRQKSQEGSNT